MEHNPAPKKRSFRWAVTIGLIIGTICVTAFAFLYKLPTVYKYETDSLGVATEQRNEAFLSVATQNEEADVPYLKTGFKDTFYTIDKENVVTFHEYNGKKFVKKKPTEKIKVTLSQGDSKALVDISILTNDGFSEGYGVYTNPESIEFPYAFVKLTTNNISKDDYEYLLYVDYSIDDFYKNSKTYSMLYAFDTGENELKAVFSNKGVTSGADGLVDDSFILIPGDFTGAKADGFYYLTDRNHEPGKGFDLYKKTKVSGKEQLVCGDVSAPHLFFIDDSVCFFMNANSDSESSEFNLCKMKDGKPAVLRTYSGSPDQYAVRGNYIFNAAAKTLFNVETGSNDGVRTSISVNVVQDFAVSEDGSKLALAGNFAGNSEKLFFYNLKNDRSNTIDGADLFVSNHSNLAFLEDSVYIVIPGSSPEKISNFIISWDAIFSLN